MGSSPPWARTVVAKGSLCSQPTAPSSATVTLVSTSADPRWGSACTITLHSLSTISKGPWMTARRASSCTATSQLRPGTAGTTLPSVTAPTSRPCSKPRVSCLVNMLSENHVDCRHGSRTSWSMHGWWPAVGVVDGARRSGEWESHDEPIEAVRRGLRDLTRSVVRFASRTVARSRFAVQSS
jgi:hypothetical protein